MTLRSRAMIVGVALIVVMGCAKPPSDIEPRATSDIIFLHFNCQELADLAVDTKLAIEREWEQQQTAAEIDTAGMMLILVPLASLTGNDIEHSLAQYLGEAAAIERVWTRKRCGFDTRFPGY